MQLIWVSGPASKVVTLSITAQKMAMVVAAMASFFYAPGFCLAFCRPAVGHRVRP